MAWRATSARATPTTKTCTACVGKFDFVMANPPFNVDRVDKDRLKGRPALPLRPADHGQRQLPLDSDLLQRPERNGRAGFVMANSASDARGSELEIRKKLIEARAVDVMVAVGSNFFYTVTLPCTLWFFDRGKARTERADKVLFIDARHLYRQIDRAHRDLTPAQIEFLANIVRLYRSEEPEMDMGSHPIMQRHFPNGKYVDVPGLCRVAGVAEIETQGWSLNPGRYVGVAEREDEGFDFAERLVALNEELEGLNVEARDVEERIAENIAKLLEAFS